MIRIVHHKKVTSGTAKNESIPNSEITTGSGALGSFSGTLMKVVWVFTDEKMQHLKISIQTEFSAFVSIKAQLISG